MQKIIDNLGITISAVCAIHCIFLPVIFIIAPYSFLSSHEFHEVLIYFIIPSAFVAFVLGCRKHGDKIVAEGTKKVRPNLTIRPIDKGSKKKQGNSGWGGKKKSKKAEEKKGKFDWLKNIFKKSEKEKK
mgnify:CR=1 FL=1